eukprot:m51a1_g663 hypothetical protein (288) ;mRNA; f:235987-237243
MYRRKNVLQSSSDEEDAGADYEQPSSTSATSGDDSAPAEDVSSGRLDDSDGRRRRRRQRDARTRRRGDPGDDDGAVPSPYGEVYVMSSWHRCASVFPLNKFAYTFGSSEECDVQISRAGVARHHATLWFDTDTREVMLRSTCSENPVLFNGLPLPFRSPVIVQDSDYFAIGYRVFVFRDAKYASTRIVPRPFGNLNPAIAEVAVPRPPSKPPVPDAAAVGAAATATAAAAQKKNASAAASPPKAAAAVGGREMCTACANCRRLMEDNALLKKKIASFLFKGTGAALP